MTEPLNSLIRTVPKLTTEQRLRRRILALSCRVPTPEVLDELAGLRIRYSFHVEHRADHWVVRAMGAVGLAGIAAALVLLSAAAAIAAIIACGALIIAGACHWDALQQQAAARATRAGHRAYFTDPRPIAPRRLPALGRG